MDRTAGMVDRTNVESTSSPKKILIIYILAAAELGIWGFQLCSEVPSQSHQKCNLPLG